MQALASQLIGMCGEAAPARGHVRRPFSREAGADSLTRTDDLPLTRRLLYQLSYAGEALNYRAPDDAP